MNWNTKLFFKINSLVYRKHWADIFGLAGAEWVVFAMIAWYAVADVVINWHHERAMFVPIAFLGTAWALGWLISLGIGIVVREPRPHVRFPQTQLLFTPLENWKSFPSDHAFTAWLIVFLALIFNLPGVEMLPILALWVCWGRVYAGVHYPFDIIGGASLAGLMAVASYYVAIVLS